MRKEVVVALVKLLMKQLEAGDTLYISLSQFDLDQLDIEYVIRELQYAGLLVRELYDPVSQLKMLGVTRVSLSGN